MKQMNKHNKELCSICKYQGHYSLRHVFAHTLLVVKIRALYPQPTIPLVPQPELEEFLTADEKHIEYLIDVARENNTMPEYVEY